MLSGDCLLLLLLTVVGRPRPLAGIAPALLVLLEETITDEDETLTADDCAVESLYEFIDCGCCCEATEVSCSLLSLGAILGRLFVSLLSTLLLLPLPLEPA